MARRNGEEWYVGSMTNWDEREIDIPLDFLENGKYTAAIWKDGNDANINPTSLIHEEFDVDNSTIVKIKLAKGGGEVMYIRRKSK